MTAPDPDLAGHTPGPWLYNADFDQIEAEVGPVIACALTADEFPCRDEDDDERLAAELVANARLIAAAPTLLAERDALRAALDRVISDIEAAVERAQFGIAADIALDDALIRARAALAKAGGA